MGFRFLIELCLQSEAVMMMACLYFVTIRYLENCKMPKNYACSQYLNRFQKFNGFFIGKAKNALMSSCYFNISRLKRFGLHSKLASYDILTDAFKLSASVGC